MVIDISRDAGELGRKAAKHASSLIRKVIEDKGEARLVLSTGSSQFETLQALASEDLEWNRVEVFHLDEYIGLPLSHKASFRKYLHERFIDLVPVRRFHAVDVEGNIEAAIRNLTLLIREKPVDLGLIGIGVNAHIAFNDPPADFNTREAYIRVNLDEECIKQQVDEGWFSSAAEVPPQAVSMTPWQIMQCSAIISCVPHKVKATAVKNTLLNSVTEIVPATLLKTHPDYCLYLDHGSASGIINMV